MKTVTMGSIGWTGPASTLDFDHMFFTVDALIDENFTLNTPEDTILTGDLSVLDWFKAEGQMSVKIDGAPAIVWGKDPATGTFFVGTKVSSTKENQDQPPHMKKLNKPDEGEAAFILHDCLIAFPHIDGIVQGDFIGYGGDDTYTPNAITYVFLEIIKESIIVAPHTYYTADKDLRDAVSSLERLGYGR